MAEEIVLRVGPYERYGSSPEEALENLKEKRAFFYGFDYTENGAKWHLVGRAWVGEHGNLYAASSGIISQEEGQRLSSAAFMANDRRERAERMQSLNATFPRPLLFRGNPGNVSGSLRRMRVFPERQGVQPRPGEVYEVLSVRENPKGTVYFAKLGKKLAFPIEQVRVCTSQAAGNMLVAERLSSVAFTSNVFCNQPVRAAGEEWEAVILSGDEEFSSAVGSFSVWLIKPVESK